MSDLDRLALQADFIVPKIMTVVEGLGLEPSCRVLDAGCGTGNLLGAIDRRYPAATLTGVDREEGVLTAARTGDHRAAFLQAALPILPFADGSFDLVTSTFVLSHLADRQEAVSELVRLLAPAGCLLLLDVDDATWRVSPGSDAFDELLSLLGRWSESHGGSRVFGRHLATAMASSGLVDLATHTLPFDSSEMGSEAFDQVFFEIFRRQVPRMTAAGLVSETRAERLIDELDRLVAAGFHSSFETIGVVGRKRA